MTTVFLIVLLSTVAFCLGWQGRGTYDDRQNRHVTDEFHRRVYVVNAQPADGDEPPSASLTPPNDR